MEISTAALVSIVIFAVVSVAITPIAVAQDMTINSVQGTVVWANNLTPAEAITVNVTCFSTAEGRYISKEAITKSSPPVLKGQFTTGDVPGWNDGDAFTIAIPGYAIVSGNTSGTLFGDTTNVGNLSISIPEIDTEAPVTTVNVTAPAMPGEPSPLPSGHEMNWTNTAVMLSFRRVDPHSTGVAYTNYSKTSETGPWTTVNATTAIGPDAANVSAITTETFNLTVSDEGATKIWYYSVDQNETPNDERAKLGFTPNLTVRIDTAAPLLTLDVEPGCGDVTLNGTFSDPQSGINASSFELNVDGAPVTPTIANGTYTCTVLLTQGMHNASAYIEDNVGNPANPTSEFFIGHDLNVTPDYYPAGNGIKIVNGGEVPAGADLIINVSYTIRGRMVNDGTCDEPAVDATIEIFNETGLPVYQSGTISTGPINVTDYQDVERPWDTTSLAAGTYTIWVNASVPEDYDWSNNNRSRVVTLVEAVKPSITDWYNDKTGDNSTLLTINESECVHFTATADQMIDTWRWLVNAANQNHNFDNFTYCGWAVNGTYTVTVDATNPNGTSSPIAWTVTVNDITPPAKVMGLTNDTPTHTTVNLSWNANPEGDLVGYKVYQDGVLRGTTPNTYFNVTGLTPSTTYTFSVAACDDNDLEGEWANVTVTTARPPYDVELTADKYADEVAPNKTMTYTLTVRNTGTMNDTYNVTVDDLANASLSKNVTNELQPAETDTIDLNVMSATAGIVVVNVTVTSQTDANVTDIRMFTTTVAEIYRVNVSADKFADTVHLGEIMVYTVTVKNTGTMNDTYNVTVDDLTNASLSKPATALLQPDETDTIYLNVSSATKGTILINLTVASQTDANVSEAKIFTTTVADIKAPAQITDLATSSPTTSSITLTWTAPGDDGNVGTASEYDIRYSTSAITEANWGAATQCSGEPAPQVAGTSESYIVTGLSSGTQYYFAIKTGDEENNWSPLSNVASGTTESGFLGARGGGGAPRDSDGDGLSDLDELITYYTDPYKADTDEGGVNDGQEVARGTNPLDPADDIPPTATPPASPTATPTATPTVPPTITPTGTPTATPTPTPGFEAIFAIAGLLAIAYVVLRRKK